MDASNARIVMNADDVARALRRIAGEVTERNRGADGLCLVGVRRGGVPLAYRLRVLLRELEGRDVPVGTVDINLYRDDLGTSLAAPVVGRSDIHFDLDGRVVLLVDDVLYTGRTVRAAIDALMDYGRPKAIQLCALIDRGHRELPIAADYIGRVVETRRDERVDVILDAEDATPDRAEVRAATAKNEAGAGR
ncbi:MAG: bifunctional pyr operon transcriptional regulator/uracil phosphoribosyltransferase PyrR [Polyangiales bacterium]